LGAEQAAPGPMMFSATTVMSYWVPFTRLAIGHELAPAAQVAANEVEFPCTVAVAM
jgi:hypothetical protein